MNYTLNSMLGIYLLCRKYRSVQSIFQVFLKKKFFSLNATLHTRIKISKLTAQEMSHFDNILIIHTVHPPPSVVISQ